MTSRPVDVLVCWKPTKSEAERIAPGCETVVDDGVRPKWKGVTTVVELIPPKLDSKKRSCPWGVRVCWVETAMSWDEARAFCARGLFKK